MAGLIESLTSGLGYVGDALDKPGRAVRGVLAGKGREGLAALPFSDSLGITDEHDRTTGRDLLDHYGITSRHSHSWGADALGSAAEMVTDPLSLAGGYGAFKAAPTVAKGLVAGGKAISGLDLVDSLRAGGRAIRGRFRGAGDGASLVGDLHHVGVPDVPDDLIRGTRVPGAMGFGGDLDDEAPSLGMRFLRNGKDAELGSTHFGDLSNMDSGAAARMFPHAVQPGDPTRRINGIELSPKYRGKGLGQAMYLDMMGQHPGHWFYNSQASSSAAAAADALESKGLIEHYRLPGEGERPHVGRITDAGLEALSHPDLLKSLRQGLGFPDPLPLPPRPGEAAMMGMPPLREMPAVPKQGLLGRIGALLDGSPATPGMMSFGPNGPGASAFGYHVPDHLADLWTPTNKDLIQRGLPDLAEDGGLESLERLLAKGEVPRSELESYLSDAHLSLAQTDPHHVGDLWTPENQELISARFPPEAEEDGFDRVKHFGDLISRGEMPRDELLEYIREATPLPPDTIDPALEHAAREFAGRYDRSYPTPSLDWLDQHPGVNRSDVVRSWLDFTNAPQHADDDSISKMIGGLNTYASSEYLNINKRYRDVASGVEGATHHWATPGLDKVWDVARTPEDMPQLFRGVGGDAVEAIERQLGVPLHSPEAIGRTFTEPGVLSTADNIRTAQGYQGSSRGGGALFEFPDVPAGRPAMLGHLMENEVIFPPGRQLTIRDNSQYPHIKADLLSALLAALGGASVAGAMSDQPSMN